MRFGFVILLAALNGCVCLQPVEERPDSGLNDSGMPVIEQPMTSFIAPVPVEDIGERERFFWLGTRQLGIPLYTGAWPDWRSISWTTDGELLIDAVGGIVFPDGGYISVANDAWRNASLQTQASYPNWTLWNGDWYRYTYPAPIWDSTNEPMQLWSLNRDRNQLELVATIFNEVDAGSSQHFTFIDANGLWNGTTLWIFDAAGNGRGDLVDGRVTVASTLGSISTSPSFASRAFVRTNGIDGDTRLLWSARSLGNLEYQEVLTRFHGSDVVEDTIDSGFCAAPVRKRSATIEVGCLSDAGLDVWVADRNGARIVGHNTLPTEITDSFVFWWLVQLDPQRIVYVSPTDAGTALMHSCDTVECHDLFELFATPPDIGVDDAGALYIADYILDAGVRVTRFAPGAW